MDPVNPVQEVHNFNILTSTHDNLHCMPASGRPGDIDRALKTQNDEYSKINRGRKDSKPANCEENNTDDKRTDSRRSKHDGKPANY